MKICEKHWVDCRAAIDNRGLTHLIKSGKELIDTTVAQLESGEKIDPKDYDPLSSLNFMLWGRAIELMGMQAMLVDESLANDATRNHGHICPLCSARAAFDYHNTPTGTCGDPQCTLKVEQGSTPWDTKMIDGASDAIFEHCKNVGLVQTQ